MRERKQVFSPEKDSGVFMHKIQEKLGPKLKQNHPPKKNNY